MQKLYIILLSLILSLSTLQITYANTDYPIGSLTDYRCDPVTGIGTLKLVFGSTYHHLDTRYYTLSHEGYYSLTNGNVNYSFANITKSATTYIPGCSQACNIGPIAGDSLHAPVNWKHEVMPWPTYPNPVAIGNESHPDAYVHSGHWPNWIQAESGFTPWGDRVAEYYGDTEERGWNAWFEKPGLVGFGTAIITFSPIGNGIGQCAKCSASIDPGTLYSSPVTPKCDQGTVAGAATTVVNGVTNYTWSCTSGGGTAASCNAQYKPLDPTDCNEYRLPRQCSYGIKTSDKSQETSTGPLTISLVNQLPISTSPYAPGACRVPVDGKPRVVCDADPFTTISSTLTSFTLPSSVTQKQGNCRVIFDAKDTCAPREDTITFKGVPVKPDAVCPDSLDPRCDYPKTTNNKVCIKLTDKFKNIVTYQDATKVTITGEVSTNSYITSDTSRYSLGEVTVVDDTLCVDVKPPKPCISGDPMCPVVPPTSTGDTWCVPGWTACPGSSKVTTLTIGIGNPGGSSFTYTPADMATRPSGGIIIKKKSCTGHLEVQDGESWSTDGVMYDTDQLYRVVVDGSDATACNGGTLSIRSISSTGGTFETTPTSLSATGTFVAKILRPTDATTTERHPRGVYASLMYTEPSGGIRYGLTASDSDFTDSPLIITGDRMKGVRVLGNTLGSNMSMFNHNNGNAIAEQTALVTESRNAMIKNVNLLTRGMTDARLVGGKVINGILYIEGDVSYSDILGRDFQTLVVKGGNLILDSDIGSGGISGPKGIIVIRGDKPDAGNIIVAGGVTYIHASIFAEGIFRGSSNLASIPNKDLQFVLKGSLFSRNTIGGSADPAALYTSGNAKTESLNDAFIQDLNHVRSGNGGAKYKGYTDPFIIDYDNMQGSPLPGFSN